MRLEKWLNAAGPFIQEVVSRRGLIIVYSPRLRPVAEDLESKLSESALLFSQLSTLDHLLMGDTCGFPPGKTGHERQRAKSR